MSWFDDFRYNVTIDRRLWYYCLLISPLVQHICVAELYWHITFRPRRNGHHFAESIFKRIFFNGNVWISIKTSSKFVPKSQIKKIPTLVQVMARYPPGTKPSFKSVMDSHQSPQRNRFKWETYWNLPDFVYKIALKVTACNFAAIVSVGRWVNWRIEAWRRRYASVKSVTISSGDAVCVHWKRRNKNSVNFETKCQHFLSRQCIWKCLQNGGYS